MKVVRSLAGGPCGAADDCPEVYELEGGAGLVRGHKVAKDDPIRAELGIPGNEELTVLPPHIMNELRG